MSFLKKIGGVLKGAITGSNPLLGVAADIGSTVLQNRANKRMWHLSNQYNSPQMQMARLKEAGLNPNLVYGSGGVTGNTTSQAPNINRLPLDQVNPMDVLGRYQDLRQKTAQADLAEESSVAQKIQNKFLNTKLLQEQGLRFVQGQKGYAEIGRGNKEVLDSPFMQKYSADVLNKQQQNALQKVQLDFYKKLPKELQFLAPLLLKFLK